MSMEVMSPIAQTGKSVACRAGPFLSLWIGLFGLVFACNASAGKLHQAALTDNAELIATLLASGEPINERDSDAMWPLLIACTYGNEQAVDALLEGGANVNLVDSSGYSVLHEASFQGYVNIVQMLIDAGVDLNKRDISNHTPLEYAELQNRAAVVRLLKQHGATG